MLEKGYLLFDFQVTICGLPGVKQVVLVGTPRTVLVQVNRRHQDLPRIRSLLEVFCRRAEGVEIRCGREIPVWHLQILRQCFVCGHNHIQNLFGQIEFVVLV